MPIAPYALVRASLNGGAVQTGGIVATGGEVVQLSADPAGLAGATQARWEILDKPDAFTVPAGWSTAADGSFFSTATTPPSFTLLTNANWGKYILRLTLNGGGPALTGRETAAQRQAIAALTDVATALSVPSVDGLRDLAYYEGSQFGGIRGWARDFKANLRLLQTLITGAGGGSGTNNHSALSNLLVDSHTQYLPLSGVRAMAAALGMGGFKITSLGTPTASTDAATKAYVDSVAGFAPAGTPAAGDVVKWNGANPVWGSADAFTITGFAATVSVLEVGATATTPSFTAAENRTPATLLLTNTDNAESKDVHATPTAFASSQSYTKTTNNAAVAFTITGSDGVSSANRSASLNWRPRVFWGAAAHGLNNEAGIEGLSNSALQASRVGSFSANATGSLRIYWAAPASYGTPTFTVGGFSGGFTLVSNSISVTNAFGVTQLYQLWESDTPGLGSTNVTVS